MIRLGIGITQFIFLKIYIIFYLRFIKEQNVKSYFKIILYTYINFQPGNEFRILLLISAVRA